MTTVLNHDWNLSCVLLPNMDVQNSTYFCITSDQTPQNAASDQGLHCALTECSIKIWIKIKSISQQPLKWEWTGPIVKNGKSHLAWIGKSAKWLLKKNGHKA